MSKPLVSIITPTYNHEKFIGQCIKSVLAQTYPYWEMIIVDDGSTDKTGEIIAQYDDPRIRYFIQRHKGIKRLVQTYNFALSQAQGELIAIVEGDDFWPPYKLELQVKSFNDHGVILSYGPFYVTNYEGKIYNLSGSKLPKSVRCNDPLGSATAHILKRGEFTHSSTVMIWKDALLSIGGFQGDSTFVFVDYPTFLKLGLIGKFSYIEKPLGYWRTHSSSTTSHSDAEIAENWAKYKLNFYRANRDTLINFIGEAEVERAGKVGIFLAYIWQGRVALYQKDWKVAKELFQKAISIAPSIKLKVISIACLFISLMKVNILESIWKLFKGYNIKDRIGETNSKFFHSCYDKK